MHHVRSLIGMTRYQQVLPKLFSRESNINYNYSPVPFRSEVRMNKTYGYSESDSPIGELTFPGQSIISSAMFL